MHRIYGTRDAIVVIYTLLADHFSCHLPVCKIQANESPFYLKQYSNCPKLRNHIRCHRARALFPEYQDTPMTVLSKVDDFVTFFTK